MDFMSTFVGVGLGPIQTGIFLAGASKGGFSRIVIAEVNDKVKDAVNAAHSVTIHIAAADRVYSETYPDVEVWNPLIPEEREKLVQAASEASELATALPSVKFFSSCAPWMREGFELRPEARRFIYTAENNNHAAEELAAAVGKSFPNTFYLNTVVGKMSGVFEAVPGGRSPIAPGAGVGHLVEEFSRIYISSCPEIEKRQVRSLYEKKNLYPFEEAKLYGHNAVHFLLGMLGKTRSCAFMSELAQHPDLMAVARAAFVGESGAALVKKYAALQDELFTEKGFTEYADDLLKRMTNPFLKDAVSRITRDLERKLGWDDRVIGTMRLVLSQGFEPANFAVGARLALAEYAGDSDKKTVLEKLWPAPWTQEHDAIAKRFL